MQKIDIPTECAGKRLDQCIAIIDSSISRSEAAKLIKRGEVLVNDEKEKASYKVRSSDVVTVISRLQVVEPLRPIKKELSILFEDKNIVVIDKPINLTVHPPNENDPQETLVNYLLHYLPSIKDVGGDALRPGIVHRLDKLASGAIVVAKNQKSFDRLQQAWQDGLVHKTYSVLVWGVLDENGVITSSIARSKRTGKMVATNGEPGVGKPAETHYAIDTKYTNATLLSVTTFTGRMHQIRAHFKSIGHPVVGDPIYEYKKAPRSIRVPRLFLHASTLTLPLLNDEEKTFDAPLPSEYTDFLEKLKQKA